MTPQLRTGDSIGHDTPLRGLSRRWFDVDQSKRIAGFAVLTFGVLTALRVRGIGSHFWMLQDQIRDWSLVLGPFSELPLVGSPTHFGGYTIGPAFYWVLWLFRVAIGPWFQDLPHAGGIGQAILQSGADALLLVAIWRRFGSFWIALATVVLVATAAYDLALSSLVWNPTMGSTLAKVAIALVLLDWHIGSTPRVVMTVAVAWSAVHAYTGAIFVAVGVCAAVVSEPIRRCDWSGVRRVAAVIALTIVLLQLPYLGHRLSQQADDGAMGGVVDSVGRILSGTDEPAVWNSIGSYVRAVQFIVLEPWRVPLLGWGLVVSGLLVAVRYRRDRSLLAVTVLPQLAAVGGYAFFLADLNDYYYLSLMPGATLMVVLAVISSVPARWVNWIAIGCVAVALGSVPGKVRLAATMHRMPEYRLLVDGSRRILSARESVRSIATDFALPSTADPEFLYTVLGGRIDSGSPWSAAIAVDGGVVYRRAEGP